jgi:hypothetical protein
MARFATTSGERTISSLARKLYDVRDKEALQKVEKALADANPALKDIRDLTSGTPVEVPDVRGVEFTAASGSLSDVAGRTALHTLRDSLPDLRDALHNALNEQVSARRAELRSLDSAVVKRVARDDVGLTARLVQARKVADATLQQAVALRKDQPKAIEELQRDLDDLLNLFS